MKKKNIVLIKKILFILVLLPIMSGCSEEDKPSCNEDPIGGVSYLKINKIVPTSVGYSGGQFRIYGAAGFWGGDRLVELRIRREASGPNDTCLAWTEAMNTGSNNDQLDYRHNTSLLYEGCGEPNYRYLVMLRDLTYPDSGLHSEMYFTWGEANLQWLNAYIETARMPALTSSIQTNTNSSINQSFNTNLIRVTPNFSTKTLNINANFLEDDAEGLVYVLDSCASAWKEEPYGNYPFHLILALKLRYPLPPAPDAGYIGISYNKRLQTGYHNWSYVFISKIDSIFSSSSFVKQSIYNQVAIHELLHQIGNAFNDDNDPYSHHYYHTGQDSGKCALHPPDHFQSVEFRTLTTSWKICDRHITTLRGLYEQPFVAKYPSAGNLNSNKNCKYEIQMSLAKYEYKQYEPVIAKFAVINKDSKPMNIYNLFNPELDQTSIMIYDNFGNKWNTNKIPFVFDVATLNPKYVINPGDTLILSMPINNWGEKYEILVDNQRPERHYFEQFGYFPYDRTYKAYLYFGKPNVDMYKCDLKSNEVEFKVTKLDEQDSALLKDYLELMKYFEFNKLDEIILKYPDNIFIENVYMKYLRSKALDLQDSNELLGNYNIYFDKYPNSYYLFDHRFLSYYFGKLKNDKVSKEQAIKIISNDNVKKSIKWFLK